MDAQKKLISVIIPAYNEEDVLDQLIERLIKALESWEDDNEILFVDDGSRDRTWEIIKKYNKKYKNIKGIKFSRNFGHQAAVTAGLNYVKGDAALVIDADLQDPPELLLEFINKWKEGYDVIYAVRKKRKESLFKKISYFLFYRLLQKLSEIKIPLDSGDFCLMDRKVIDKLNELPEKRRFIRGLRAWVGFKQTKLEYERPARVGGEPKYSIIKLIELALNGLLSFSSLPLRFASIMGLIFAGTSFFGFIFFLVYRIFDLTLFGYKITQTAGITTILLTVLFLGGIQLITIGIIGEYVGRIFEEIKGRPTYILGDTLGI
ncbi:MAG: glycosyltransferase [Candidatus Auribacter fodinae]|jgi:dolichol-phosphate mannosyltransferase|uniref:Glycosyltransferase n=1 Tax=Candidatus Auribacter fodinae TaxID=2093366 RepID=A0A3A4R3B4_9BACT|nr:MAG: glycosyltransferase [Candidatus Auribacter fodinae]